jgi:DnaK suppressor protein
MPRSHLPLTEDLLLKMPDKDYMNEAQLAFFRARLATQGEEILANIDSSVTHLRDDAGLPADPADRATLEEEHVLELRVRDRERKLLKKIESALVRINDGSYGYCLETGDPIGLRRLLVRPSAEYSIEAQERHEKREKTHA